MDDRWIDDPLSLWDRLRAESTLSGQRVYVTFGDAALTVREAYHAADSIREALANAGLGAGARIAVMLPNCLEHVLLVLALLGLRAVHVPLNIRGRGPGLAHILRQSRPTLVIADRHASDAVSDATQEAGWTGTLVLHDPETGPAGLQAALAQAVGRRTAVTESLSTGNADAIATVSYTSGTTGPPKGVQITERMLRTCVAGVLEATRPREGDVFFVWEPLCHMGGLQMVLVPLATPNPIALHPRFSARTFWQDVHRSKATHIHYLGGVLHILLKRPAAPGESANAVRVAWGAGATADVRAAFSARFGVEVREVYGLTETSSINTIDDGGAEGSIGRPTSLFDVEVVDEHRTPVAAGRVGEIRVRGREPGMVTPGYLENAEATSRLLPGDGWLYTGDLGHRDDAGNLYFDGRMTDSVRVRGENVSAWEVESVVRAHPAIEDCAIVGVPGELGENDIKLLVQRNSAVPITELELVDWCASRLASYQVPRYVAWVDEFPRGPSMRIEKSLLDRSVAGCWDRVAAAGDGPGSGRVRRPSAELRGTSSG